MQVHKDELCIYFSNEHNVIILLISCVFSQTQGTISKVLALGLASIWAAEKLLLFVNGFSKASGTKGEPHFQMEWIQMLL